MCSKAPVIVWAVLLPVHTVHYSLLPQENRHRCTELFFLNQPGSFEWDANQTLLKCVELVFTALCSYHICGCCSCTHLIALVICYIFVRSQVFSFKVTSRSIQPSSWGARAFFKDPEGALCRSWGLNTKPGFGKSTEKLYVFEVKVWILCWNLTQWKVDIWSQKSNWVKSQKVNILTDHKWPFLDMIYIYLFY